jgi:uncharacterized protein YbjT (DUF2867 family)
VTRTVTVFGGTGFLGRRVVQALARRGCTVRAAARHPDANGSGAGDSGGAIRPIAADVHDEAAVSHTVDGADGVVNAVSLYHERGGASFEAVHVDGARRVADAVRRHGVPRLVSLSGIGADPASDSPYVRARGAGEAAVRGAFPDATLFRPSAMFGPDDALLTALIDTTRMPAIPLFGRGATRLQPVSVEDVAEAAARVLLDLPDPAPLYELGGPGIFTYRELVGLALRATGRRRPLVPVPFAAWDAIAAAMGLLPSPPVTEGMVALMRRDNVADPRLPGLAALGVTPRPLQAELDRRAAR